MEAGFAHFFAGLHWSLLALAIAAALYTLGKGADWLVSEAVELSERLKIPQMVVGATIVSLGTTAPEAAVSVLAAIQGKPGLALGNAVGSVITDTGLILGLACIIAPLRLDRKIVNRQGWMQLGAGFLLVLLCLPPGNPDRVFSSGGRLPQTAGFLLIGLLAAYLYLSVRWARERRAEEKHDRRSDSPAWPEVLKLIAAAAIVVISARVLIPAVNEAALRLSVPESIIAATLVAFGTSLPELVTAVTAARRGHGEIAVGNVIGADILNVLFVAGTAASVTAAGLEAGPNFFTVLFPAMLFILIVFRLGVLASGDVLRRPFGYVLAAAYLAYMAAGYYLLPAGAPG